MAKIKVGSGFGKVTLHAALQRAALGDLIILDPGYYDVGQVSLRGIKLQGKGAPDQVTINGSFVINGHCAFTNLTIRPVPYRNAIYVESSNNMATVTSCIVTGDVSGKYPSIWCGGGTLVLNEVTAHSDPEQVAVNVCEGGKLHATATQLGNISIQSAKADLIDSTTSLLRAGEGARVSTFGAHRCTSLPGKRAFVLHGQSVCNFSHLVLASDYEEGYARDSVVQIGTITQEEGGSVKIITEEGARVSSSSEGLTVVEGDAEPSEPTPSTGPKTIEWPLKHAKEFRARIAPQLELGDTVVLDEGDYTLDDALPPATRLRGKGQSLTRVHGTIVADSSGTTTVSSLTICAPSPEVAAIGVDVADVQLNLEDVALQPASDADVTVLFANAGNVNLHNCTVLSPTLDSGDRPEVLVTGSAHLEATNSDLGWLRVERGATAVLSQCSSFQVWVNSGATITVSDEHHILENELNLCGLWVSDGGTLNVPVLTTSNDLHALLDGGVIDLADFKSTEDNTLSLQRVHGEVLGIEPEGYNLLELDENDEWVLVREAARGSAVQAHGEDRPEQHVHDVTGGNQDATPDSATPHDASVDPLTELNTLVGLEKVKKQVQGFVNAVKLRQKRAELGLPTEGDFTLHSMFLGNPGTGKTTVARLIGTAMCQAGVVESEHFVETGRAELISDIVGGTAKQTRELLQKGRGGVVFIDEAYSLASKDSAGFADEAVTEILTFMENHRSDTMVILAGYSEKVHELLAMNEGFNSRIKHRFDFEDYSPAEIAQIGLAELARGHYTVNEELYRRIVGSAYKQSADRSNARWARNFNQDLRAQQEERVILIEDPTREDLITIRDEDLHALAGGRPEDRKARLAEKLADLDAMVGLEPVKNWVHSLVEQAIVNQRMIELEGTMERPNYHVAFTGNPGTGKTTVARLVAEIFHLLGILATPTVKSVAASQLLVGYINQSSEKTHKAFDAAMGGVLFVDEAHQLRGGESRNESMKQEVVNAMITRLEDDRDKFVAVFAGYTDQMHEFFASDPGLKSRIPGEIQFPDYTSAEVAQIATAVLSKQWKFNTELFTEVAINEYERLPAQEQSNGRWARTFAEEVVARHNRYLMENDIHGEEMKHIQDELLRELDLSVQADAM